MFLPDRWYRIPYNSPLINTRHPSLRTGGIETSIASIFKKRTTTDHTGSEPHRDGFVCPYEIEGMPVKTIIFMCRNCPGKSPFSKDYCIRGALRAMDREVNIRAVMFENHYTSIMTGDSMALLDGLLKLSNDMDAMSNGNGGFSGCSSCSGCTFERRALFTTLKRHLLEEPDRLGGRIKEYMDGIQSFRAKCEGCAACLKRSQKDFASIMKDYSALLNTAKGGV